MIIVSYISEITLNVNELNAVSKRHRVTEWKKKKKSKALYMLSTRDPPNRWNMHRLKVRGWKKYSMQIEIKSKRE